MTHVHLMDAIGYPRIHLCQNKTGVSYHCGFGKLITMVSFLKSFDALLNKHERVCILLQIAHVYTIYFIKWMWGYWGNGTNKIIRQNPINGNHSKHDGQHCMHAQIVGGRITAGRRKRCLSTCRPCIGRAIPATSKSLQVMMVLMLAVAALPLPILCHWGGSSVGLFLVHCYLSFVCMGQRRQGETREGIKSKNVMTLH